MVRHIGRIITPANTRWAYVNVNEPHMMCDGSGRLRYSIRLIIPKVSPVISEINDAIYEIWEKSEEINTTPFEDLIKTPLVDGDIKYPNVEEYRDCYYINANCDGKSKPDVIDINFERINDPAEIYSGCYGRACIQFYPFRIYKKDSPLNGKCGIGTALRSLQKTRDGERLGKKSNAFNDFYGIDKSQNDFAQTMNFFSF